MEETRKDQIKTHPSRKNRKMGNCHIKRTHLIDACVYYFKALY